MTRYPIGIQSFEKIRSSDFYYVDKTRFVSGLVEEGSGYYFLSRPRRFGKSLFLDTLHQAFAGRKMLFQDLFLEDRWDWNERFPVMHISFGSGIFRDRDSLRLRFDYLLSRCQEEYGVRSEQGNISDRFDDVVRKIAETRKKSVVILVDEYDKPILDNIENPELAIQLREELKSFYSVIKDLDSYLKFVFITGVSRFSRVNIFSGLNNLKDISLDSRYATICGYTQSEFEHVFKVPLEGSDPSMVKRWYNGYNFNGEPVYNPFDVLLHFDTGKFGNFWFETGTPTFLIKLLKSSRYYIPSLECFEAGETLLGSFEVEHLKPETLLFQTGYLTIKKEISLGLRKTYLLGFPNHEVRMSFSDLILDHYSYPPEKKEKHLTAVYRALREVRMDDLKEIFRSFFSSIPHDWYRKNRIGEYEGYYASVFYSYFTAAGLDVTAEDATSKGRIDLTVQIDGKIYIMEFKVIEIDAKRGTAIEQIKAKRYFEKYLEKQKKIYLVGIEFSKNDRNIVNFDWEAWR